MKMLMLAGLIAAPLLTFAPGRSASAADTAAPTPCKDGTTSASTGRGTCSGHGGVRQGQPAPPGATAHCKDGTYSKSKTHSGTCSGHGGVSQWLDPH
jgi:hypothetical protein